MLYPDFNELIAFKNQKSTFHPVSRSVKSIVPGNHYSPFRGQGLEFDSVREYVPGDDIRSIDWRVTARMGSPHLKLFKQDLERHIMICVDMNATMRFGTKNTFKSVQAARAASLLGWQGIASQDRISACLFGEVQHGICYFPPKRTSKSFFSLLNMLTHPPSEQHQISLEKVLEHLDQVAHTGSLIYLISDFMDLRQDFPKSHLSRLSKRCDLIFITINDEFDKSIAPLGEIDFLWGKEKVCINTSSKAGTTAYTHVWNENRESLYEISSKLKIPIIELTTESDIRRDLTQELKKIKKRRL